MKSNYLITTLQWEKIITLILKTKIKIMNNKSKTSRARANKGVKVFQMKGTFQEVWKEYMKLNEQLKNN